MIENKGFLIEAIFFFGAKNSSEKDVHAEVYLHTVNNDGQ